MRSLLELRLGNLIVVAACVAVALPTIALAGFLLKRARVTHEALNASQRCLHTDLGYLTLGPIHEVFSRTVTTLGIVVCASLLGHHVGRDALDGFGPVVRQPRWLIIAEMLVLGDLIYYWTHRAAHAIPFLWRFHAIHHSTEHLRWTSAFRAHPLEAYVQLVNIVPLFLLGFPVDAIAPVVPIATLYAAWIHVDVNVSLRPLSYLFNSPGFHRWHHAADVQDGVKNFAGLFPIYDALFGTHHLPQELPGKVGIDDPEMPDTCIAQLAYPFRQSHAALMTARTPTSWTFHARARQIDC